jgi:DNA primase
MAGLIPQPFIDELLDRVDITEVIDARVPLKRTGRNLKGLCPFHKEKTPSFTVNGDKQFYYCFGCGAGGNAIGFLMDYERMDFPAAVETLARYTGLEVPREESPATERRKEQAPLYDWMSASSDFYQAQLRQPVAAPAVEYLKGRGLSGQVAKRFGIGFSPPGWNNLEQALVKQDKDRRQLVSAGMLIKNEDSGRIYDRFRDRIMFPIRDIRGRVVAFGGRVMGDDVPKYLNSPETPVFSKSRELYGLYEARQAHAQLRRLLVTEGYMDVVALAQHDINYAVATLGTAVGSSHLERLFRYTNEVVFCFDGDKAGRAAAERALVAALPEMRDGRQAWFLFLPEGEDPDSVVSKQGKEQFELLINEAQPLSEFMFSLAGRDINLQTVDGRARLSNQVTPMLSQLPDGAFKQLLAAELANRTGLSPQDIVLTAPPAKTRPIAEAAPTQVETPKLAPKPSPKPRQRLQSSQQPSIMPPLRKAGGLLFFNPALASGAGDFEYLADWPDQEARFLYEILTYLKQSPDTGSALLLGRWMATDFRSLAEGLIGSQELLPRARLQAEFNDTMKLLAEKYRHSRYHQELGELDALGFTAMSSDQKQRYGELRRLLANNPRRH